MARHASDQIHEAHIRPQGRKGGDTMNGRIMILMFVALAAGALRAAEPAKAPASAGGIALPPPKVELPPLPVDGSGIWRLHLEDAGPGATPLWIVMEVDKGKIARAVAVPKHYPEHLGMGVWGDVDASTLSLAPDRISGRLSFALLPPWDWPNVKLRAKNQHRPYEPKPTAPIQVELEARIAGESGSGNWSIARAANDRDPGKGTVVVRREPPLPLPEIFDLEFFLPGGLGDSPGASDEPELWLRVRMGKAGAIKVVGKILISGIGAGTTAYITVRDAKMVCAEGKVTGQIEGHFPAKTGPVPFSLRLDGQCIGRTVNGLGTLQQGDYRIATPFRGLVDIVSPVIPMADEPLPTWPRQHDLKSDPQWLAQAQEESCLPVLPGEPNKAGFWNWRLLVKERNPLGTPDPSVIYPPSFDLEETPGAAKYRCEVKAARGTQTFACEMDKPWRPLAPIWKDLPPGRWTVTMTALDPAGKPIPGPMRMGVGKKPGFNATHGEKPADYTPPSRVTVETGPIGFEKRPCFSGPYNSPPRSWHEASRLMALWERSRVDEGARCWWFISKRGLMHTFSGRTGGEGPFLFVATSLWSELALRAQSENAAQRLQSEEFIRMWLESFRLAQRGCNGMFHFYHWDTAPTHWHCEALLDAWLQTGDPAWKERGLDYGRALVKLQNANGTFLNRKRDDADLPQEPLPGPDRLGYCTYSLTYIRNRAQYGAAELLYALGRLRRDLKTDEFIQVERLAYRWMIEVGVRERYFPLYTYHSMNMGWPKIMSPMSALYFSRYLLECAPAELRDVKLAEECARWAEDFRVDWSRPADGAKQDKITPRISRMDRCEGAAGEVNLLAAVVFERLGQVTGNRLWSAKAESLATAVLMAQEPKSGYVDGDLSGADPKGGVGYVTGWMVQLLREYAALKEAKK
jgi:hypothetical protein